MSARAMPLRGVRQRQRQAGSSAAWRCGALHAHVQVQGGGGGRVGQLRLPV